MHRRFIAGAGILAAGAVALAAGHFGLPPLPLEVETGEQSKSSAPVTAARQDAATPSPSPATELVEIDGKASAPGVTTIDIARISPDGSSVFAGRAKPNEYVTLLEDGRAVGSAKADENGEWSMVTEHRFASLDPHLSFRSSTEPPAGETIAAATSDPQSFASQTNSQGTDGKRSPAERGTSALASASPSTVTAELLKKFEGMVAEAREDAKKEQAGEAAASSREAGNTDATRPAGPSSASGATGSIAAPGKMAAADDAASGASTGDTGKASAPARADAAIPVPIMFVYAAATFTPDGRRAAELLLEYLKLKHPQVVTLSGHADERGTDAYNMDLSRERLDAVATLLRDGGFNGKLDLVPKGEAEPFMGVDRTKYAGDALFQLDRRVELRLLQ